MAKASEILLYFGCQRKCFIGFVGKVELLIDVLTQEAMELKKKSLAHIEIVLLLFLALSFNGKVIELIIKRSYAYFNILRTISYCSLKKINL